MKGYSTQDSRTGTSPLEALKHHTQNIVFLKFKFLPVSHAKWELKFKQPLFFSTIFFVNVRNSMVNINCKYYTVKMSLKQTLTVNNPIFLLGNSSKL